MTLINRFDLGCRNQKRKGRISHVVHPNTQFSTPTRGLLQDSISNEHNEDVCGENLCSDYEFA